MKIKFFVLNKQKRFNILIDPQKKKSKVLLEKSFSEFSESWTVKFQKGPFYFISNFFEFLCFPVRVAFPEIPDLTN
jgi:hypothetical protein